MSFGNELIFSTLLFHLFQCCQKSPLHRKSPLSFREFGQVIAVEERAQSMLLIYEATSSRKNRCLAKELTTGAAASVFLGFGSLFLLLACGVYV
ncbi:hypothetical protein ACSBR2_004227 [Camellia fascicularis]